MYIHTCHIDHFEMSLVWQRDTTIRSYIYYKHRYAWQSSPKYSNNLLLLIITISHDIQGGW